MNVKQKLLICSVMIIWNWMISELTVDFVPSSLTVAWFSLLYLILDRGVASSCSWRQFFVFSVASNLCHSISIVFVCVFGEMRVLRRLWWRPARKSKIFFYTDTQLHQQRGLTNPGESYWSWFVLILKTKRWQQQESEEQKVRHWVVDKLRVGMFV